MSGQKYPVSVRGELTRPPSTTLWLIKWLLLIPHYIILAVLWAAYIFVCLIAFFSILFTGRFPRPLFNFNVGILRWNWRVSFYGYNALGTDEYPPFSLRSGGYPADLEVEYPERLSRGLVLIKWWLLAIPHYIFVTVMSGGFGVAKVGVTTILALAGIILRIFNEQYPEDLFNVIVGLNRWSLRVAAYAGLMTDAYPPFRLKE